MPREYITFCEEHGIKYNEYTDFSPEVINSSDILYMTRAQRERFTDIMEYEKVKNLYNLNVFVELLDTEYSNCLK